MEPASSEFPIELLSRVEDAVLNASTPPEQLLIDGWLVRFSPGQAKRSRCINAIVQGRLPLTQRIGLCEPVFEGAGLPLMVRITPFSEPPGLDDALAMLNWRSFDDTRVMVLTSLGPQGTLDDEAEADEEGLTIEPVDNEAFVDHVGRLRTSSLAQRAAHAKRLATVPVPHHALIVKRGDQVVACGQMAIEADLVGLYDVFTAPTERGHGLARLLCRHLLQRAYELGARSAYLPVDAENSAARALYLRLGFVDAYRYHYRTTDPVAR